MLTVAHMSAALLAASPTSDSGHAGGQVQQFALHNLAASEEDEVVGGEPPYLGFWAFPGCPHERGHSAHRGSSIFYLLTETIDLSRKKGCSCPRPDLRPT